MTYFESADELVDGVPEELLDMLRQMAESKAFEEALSKVEASISFTMEPNGVLVIGGS